MCISKDKFEELVKILKGVQVTPPQCQKLINYFNTNLQNLIETQDKYDDRDNRDWKRLWLASIELSLAQQIGGFLI